MMMTALSVVKKYAKTRPFAHVMLDVLPQKAVLGYKWGTVGPMEQS